MREQTPEIPRGAVEALRGARHVAVLTGAGISAESGLATFRGESDSAREEFGDDPPLWTKFDPMQLATPEAYERDPEMVSKWYDWRRGQGARAEPNPGHTALADLERAKRAAGGACIVLTQNIDGLHQRAGSENVVELHGSLWRWRCMRCGHEAADRDVPFPDYPPVCARCGEGIRRPAIVWFGEMLPEEAIRAAEEACALCDVFLSIGTSAVVFPAAGFARAAQQRGVASVEVNPEETGISSEFDWSIRGAAGSVLPRLVGEACGAS